MRIHKLIFFQVSLVFISFATVTNRYCFLKICYVSLLMFINVRVCFPDTVKSIKLSRKMFVLLSKDDRCRFYLLRLLVEGVLQKVKLNSKKKINDNHSFHTITTVVCRCSCQPLWTVKTVLATARSGTENLENRVASLFSRRMMGSSENFSIIFRSLQTPLK